jgi:Zn-dependent protease/predicted transcriptional regulator
VRIHASWLLIFFLLVFSLATYLLPMSDIAGGGAWWRAEDTLRRAKAENPGLTEAQVLRALLGWPHWQYWALGFVAAVGLFVCVLAHEIGHSLVARSSGIRVEGITLFVFGGVSSLRDEAPTAETELAVALAGPLVSVAIAVICWVLYVALPGAPEQVTSLLFYLAFINSLLVVFNLIPGFPLDGGRVLRAILWKIFGNIYRATAIAATVGKAVGLAMIVAGVFGVLLTWQLGPLWLALIGLFLRYAAQTGYQQVAIREALRGLKVRDILQERVVTVPPDLPIDRLVDEFFYRFRFRSFPVLEGDRFVGMVSLKGVQGIPRASWGQVTVAQAMESIAEENLVHPDDDLASVFRKMMSEDKGHLPVVAEGRLSGIVTRHDIMNLLHIKTDLGEDRGRA